MIKDKKLYRKAKPHWQHGHSSCLSSKNKKYRFSRNDKQLIDDDMMPINQITKMKHTSEKYRKNISLMYNHSAFYNMIESNINRCIDDVISENKHKLSERCNWKDLLLFEQSDGRICSHDSKLKYIVSEMGDTELVYIGFDNIINKCKAVRY